VLGYDPGTLKNSLWKTDGTVAGTVHILDLENPSYLFVTGDVAYFNAWDPVHGSELWRSDGTPGGTAMLADINPGTLGSNPNKFISAGALVYFAAVDGTGVQNLWQTDGTLAGTVAVQPSPAQPAPNFEATTSGMGTLGSELFFGASDSLYAGVLWKTDGTLAGTVRVVTSPQNLYPGGMTAFGGLVYFGGTDAAHGTELWSSDGTAGGTQLVWDILPGPGSSIPYQLTVVGSNLFFAANNGLGVSLWKYPP
jgi:ELWxxDGT repeat protein